MPICSRGSVGDIVVSRFPLVEATGGHRGDSDGASLRWWRRLHLCSFVPDEEGDALVCLGWAPRMNGPAVCSTN
jgi:hypothetical protein